VKRRIPPGGPLRWQAVVATCTLLVSCLRNKHIFRCDQNGPLVRQCRRSVLALLFLEEAKRERFTYTSQPFGPRPVGGFSVRQPAGLAPHVSI
jgi:hypothetical protein